MDKTDLHNFHLELLKNLWIDFVFYIPDSTLLYKALEKIDVLKDKVCFNTPLVIDYHQGPILLRDDRDNSKTIFKSAVLEQNIFNLLKKKTELQSFEFNYISKKYEEQIESLSYVANWLVNNLDNYIDCNDNLKGLFKLQQTNFSSHYSIFLEHFCPKKKLSDIHDPNLENLINNHFEELHRVITQGGSFTTISSIESRNDKSYSDFKNTTKNSTRTKKQPIITPKEAEMSILKSVFNVNV